MLMLFIERSRNIKDVNECNFPLIVMLKVMVVIPSASKQTFMLYAELVCLMCTF